MNRIDEIRERLNDGARTDEGCRIFVAEAPDDIAYLIDCVARLEAALRGTLELIGDPYCPTCGCDECTQTRKVCDAARAALGGEA